MSTTQKKQKAQFRFLSDKILSETEKRLKQTQKQNRIKDLDAMRARDLFKLNSKEAIEKKAARVFEGRDVVIEYLYDDVMQERFIGGNDLVDVRFLLRGAKLSSAIGRIKLPNGFATGFQVAPGVLMTNWHVFRSEVPAMQSVIQFGFRELGDGTLTDPTSFQLDPSKLFFANEDHDVAVVAIGNRLNGSLELSNIPFCPLVGMDEDVLLGQRLNIIQHPAGEPKQIALRDNLIFGIPDETFLQYRADTHRGSSGSPVFSDEWQVVGLHHSGVPNRDDQGRILAIGGGLWSPFMGDNQIDWIANEAIQSSALIRLLNTVRFSGQAGVLVDSILNPPPQTESVSAPGAHTDAAGAAPVQSQGPSTKTRLDNGVAKITVPVEISVRIPEFDGISTPDSTLDSVAGLSMHEIQRIGIDPNYNNRVGYSDDFLSINLPMPELTPDQQNRAAINRRSSCESRKFILDYHNFSLIQNAERRLAYYTAVNIDGDNLIRISRNKPGGKAKWIIDPRIAEHEQADNDFYKGRDNRLDRGHLVRRLDPGWGQSKDESAKGIVDTFHYTNAAPQYDKFNRSGGSDGLWLGLEDFVIDNAEMDDLRVTVFTGPVFRDDDPDFKDNGLKIPRQYWKIVAWVDHNQLQAAAFLLSQESLLTADPRIETLPDEAFDFRSRQLFQTSVQEIAQLTQLNFGPLHSGLLDESTVATVEIHSEIDIVI